MLQPPSRYEGSLTDYIDAYVLPNLPAPERIVAWIEAVVSYYDRPDPICIVRGPRRGELSRRSGKRIVEGDNSPGIWCFVRAMDGGFDPVNLPAAIEEGRIPVLAALKGKDKRDWKWNYATKALARRDSCQLWDLKLKHCHMLPVRGAAALTAQQIATRNICPANHFPFPNGWGSRHFHMERLGWSEDAPSDLGESPTVIALVQQRARERLGSNAHAYDRFLLAAGGAPLPSKAPVDRRIRIERTRAHTTNSQSHTATKRSAPATSRGVKRTVRVRSGSPRTLRAASQSTSRPPSRASGQPRRWTLNANHGYYVKTGERAQVVDLSLSYKDASGAITPVGRFRLDLPSLVDRDLVTQRGEVFDIKIVRECGRYFLGVRVSPRVPLADFAVSE